MKNAGRKQADTPTQAELKYQRIMDHRMSIPERPNGRDLGTNWNRSGTVRHTKQDNMLGEGIGPAMGLDGPKYTRSYEPGEIEFLDEEDLIYREELRFKKSLCKQRQALIGQRFEAKLPEKIQAGKVLVQQRVFMAYPKTNWDKRAVQMGGLPQGVDVAKSQFGHLIIVPVVEDPTKTSSYKDSLGRSFQIDPNLKQTVNQIFGAVRWTRPLNLKEVEQFGIEVE